MKHKVLPYAKYLLLAIYFAIATFLWNRRDFLPIPELLGSFTRDCLFFSILLTGLVCLWTAIRRPPLITQKVNRALRQAGMKNSIGEYPVVHTAYRNPNRAHEIVVELDSKGLSLLDFDNRRTQLQASLNAKVRYEEDKYTRLFILPRRYVRPTEISVATTRLCLTPNCLVVGKTGSGKSYALLTLLGAYALHYPVTIVCCDYKKSSFSQFEGCKNFYGYEDVPAGIRTVYQEFQERLAANDEKRNTNIWVLLIDEYGALVSAQDRKTTDELKTMVANMLFMGRSLGIRVLIGVQRSDSEHFKAGARDQFHAILGLGNLSKEQKQMLFNEYKDAMAERKGLGEGYLLVDGQDIEEVKVAPIQDMVVVERAIQKAMNRPTGGAETESAAPCP